MECMDTTGDERGISRSYSYGIVEVAEWLDVQNAEQLTAVNKKEARSYRIGREMAV